MDTALPEPVLVPVDDVPVATYELPAVGPTREAVVMCHGTPWSATVWAASARHLAAAGYRVLLWDMPGYGRSPKQPSIPLDLGSQMSRLAHLLTHWRVERPYVIAHDIGGAVALGAHLLHDRDYAGVFLRDVVTLDPWGSPFFRLVAEHASVFAALPPTLHAALVREYIAGAARHRLPDAVVTDLCRPWLDEQGRSAFYRQIAELSERDTRPVVARLGEVRCPAAIGWGAQDPWLPVEQARRLRAVLPGDLAVTLVDAGHLAPLEAPSQVQQALRHWLDGPLSHTTPHCG